LVGAVHATNHSVTISGFTYTPATLTVNVGDVVTIQASAVHPLVQVSQTAWDANDNTPLSGGFSSTTNFELTITAAMAGTTIFYVCSNHVLTNSMKGQITVNVVSNISENRIREYNFTVYPNPVAGNAWINLSVKKAGKVYISVYDFKGTLVNQVAELNAQPGEITIPFDATRLQKGNYILQMRTAQGIMRKQVFIQ
jgi:plastocyanin